MYNVTIPEKDNDTISLDAMFKGLSKTPKSCTKVLTLFEETIFEDTTPTTEEVEQLVEYYDSDYTGWTDFPSFLMIVLVIWQINHKITADNSVNRALANLPNQLRMARKAFYIADTDEDGMVKELSIDSTFIFI